MDHQRSFRKLFKVQGGVETTLWTLSAGYPMRTWFELKISVTTTVEGAARIRASFDGVELFNLVDTSPVTRGTVAMYSWGMSPQILLYPGVEFDNVEVLKA